jgi:peroxiredoxin
LVPVLNEGGIMGEKLNLLDRFPEISLTDTEGRTIRIPSEINADFAVVLFYRGHW